MNLPELITKLLLIERQLIEDGIDVNAVEVVKYSYTLDDSYVEADTTSIDDISSFDDIALNKKLILLD